MATNLSETNGENEKEASLQKRRPPSDDLLHGKQKGGASGKGPKPEGSLQEFSFEEFVFSPFAVESRSEVWALHVLDGPNNGAQTFLDSGRDYLIGRDADECDIVLLDPRISKKHLQLSIKKNHQAFIKDLSSTNGVTANGKPLQEQIEIDGSVVLGLGSSSILIVNTQKPQRTVVLPSEQELREILEKTTGKPVTEGDAASALSFNKIKYLLIGIASLTFLLIISLLPTGNVEWDRPSVDVSAIEQILKDQTFSYEFNEERREIVLSGHIHKQADRERILAQLSDLDFMEKIDAQRLIIDELLCREFNVVLMPQWPGVSLDCEQPGEYILAGFVDTQELYEQLELYLQLNFPFLSKLKKKILVEEKLLERLNADLQELAPNRLAAELIDGELIVAGRIFGEEEEKVDQLVSAFQEKSRYKTVRKGLVNQKSEFSLPKGSIDSLSLSQDITSRYQVSGFVKKGKGIQVYIRGKSYGQGDSLDGMKILSIENETILLEGDTGLFRISFSTK
ncbi:type III secretion system inner membrane ring subunit SctD [Candidatus Similichlamydia epinepheli]|uniref:type III secretion system inner membrane ring subunit SctD n=1 Tax=Candidatus Similichlamydia epinepheli TaxID=1903953 RepID=UPI000D379CAE|nr:type III secretion system inner membrane ring subunit SctD [Candidatus Similichlamydia epinepheli]